MRKYLALNLIAIFALVLMASCKSKQPLKEITETKETNFESIFLSKKLERNLAIIDSLKIKIGAVKTEKKECDSVCQIAIDRLLSQLNTSKKSGNNSYDMSYNEKDKSLNFNSKIGETKNSSKTEYRYFMITKTITLSKDIPVNKPLAKWQIILMLIGAAAIGYILIKIITFIRLRIS
jgi:hypothetical protein